MFMSLLGFLLLVGTIVAWVGVKYGDVNIKISKKIGVLLLVVVLFLIFRPFEIVQAGKIGVVKTLGDVTNVTNPGIAFKIPFVQTVESITIQPIQIDITIEVGPDGSITKDNQTVGANVTVFYKYQPTQMEKIYTDIGLERMSNIIRKSVVECFKQEIGAYDIFEIPMSQTKIWEKVFANVRAKISEYPIDITEIKITNYDWSDAFDKQIQETMNRAQQVKQKEQELLIAEQEAQKQVKQAQAAKEALITQAEGEKIAAVLQAEANAAKGDGIRKYNQAVQANMGLEIRLRELEIEKIKAERWNGQYVPTNNYGPIPLETGRLQQ
jgi:regulator of protease activity HflC (stomatin/prohibitin superfamily)